MRLSRRFTSAALVLVFVCVATNPVGAVETDGQYRASVWSGHEFTNHFDPSTVTCSPSVVTWVQEMETSGITRLRTWYQQYRPYSPTWDWLSLKYTNTIWYGPFPDDDDSYYVWAQLPRGLWNEAPNSGLKVAVRFVGERPGFWNTDAKGDWEVGTIFCDPVDIPDPNVTTPPPPTSIVGGGGKFEGGHGN